MHAPWDAPYWVICDKGGDQIVVPPLDSNSVHTVLIVSVYAYTAIHGVIYPRCIQDELENTGTSFLDSPNTTSAITYKLQTSAYYNRTISINVPTSTSTSANSYTATGISTITVMEVAA